MYILRIIVAVVFLLAGSAKLIGAKPLAEQFEEFGLAQWMMRAVGLLEVAGAIGLFIGPLSFLAVIGLALLMVGAIGYHLKVRHPITKSVPAALFLLLCLILIFRTIL